MTAHRSADSRINQLIASQFVACFNQYTGDILIGLGETMQTEKFEAYCEELYDLTPDQRTHLAALLTSRVWHYEDGDQDRIRFEHLYELDTELLSHVVTKTSIPKLARAWKGVSKEMRSRIESLLDTKKKASLVAAVEKLGPIRLSEFERVEGEILEWVAAQAKKGKLSFAPIHRAVGAPEVGASSHQDQVLCRSARFFLAVSDREMRALLPKLDAESVADMLGYAGDHRLTRKFLINCSAQMGEQVIGHLAAHWPFALRSDGTPPESSTDDYFYGNWYSETQRKRGRAALTKIISDVQDQIDNGQLALHVWN